MKRILFILSAFSVCTSFALSQNTSCEYASSNIGYMVKETQIALSAKDLNLARYHAYKAMNAIKRSEKEFKACACNYAYENILDGSLQLRNATRATTLASTKISLKRARDSFNSGLESIQNHSKHLTHESLYPNQLLAMNTSNSPKIINDKIVKKQPEGKLLEAKIAKSLESFQKSINDVVNTVPCPEAKVFAQRIFSNSEQALLKTSLSQAKKQYHLKTKEIAANALKKLSDCNQKK